MLLRVDRRFSGGFQMTASYALSRFKAFGGDTLGLGATVTDLNNIRKEFGPAGLDRTHRFVVSAIYDLPFGRNSSSAFKRNVVGGWQVSMISTMFSGQPFSVFLPSFVDLSRSGTFQTYLPGTGEGSIGRTVTSAAQLNSLIDAYNSSIPSLGEPCADDPAERCDAGDASDPNGFFHDPILPLAHVPNDTLIGGDSIISQDLRVTKTFSFGERMRLDLIGEVFNLFNVANLTTGGVTGFTLNDADSPGNPIPPSERTTSVFGTGGPRAFQFAAKFRFQRPSPRALDPTRRGVAFGRRPASLFRISPRALSLSPQTFYRGVRTCPARASHSYSFCYSPSRTPRTRRRATRYAARCATRTATTSRA
jgi:hypothetical protein